MPDQRRDKGDARTKPAQEPSRRSASRTTLSSCPLLQGRAGVPASFPGQCESYETSAGGRNG